MTIYLDYAATTPVDPPHTDTDAISVPDFDDADVVPF